LFLSRLPGAFLLRYAERQFAAVLFQAPPRITRAGSGLLPKVVESQDLATPVPVVRPEGVCEERRPPPLSLAFADHPALIGPGKIRELRPQAHPPRFRQSHPIGINDKTEHGNSLITSIPLTIVLQTETERSEALGCPLADHGEVARTADPYKGIIHVAQVMKGLG
jgi:hypothetical protein